MTSDLEINTQKEAEDLVYKSYLSAIGNITEFLDSKVRKPQLTRKLLDSIGAPDFGQKYILVTGSKGKGSTSRFISSLLSHLGYRVGLFTSPHLVHFNERIRIDGKSISELDFIRIMNIIKPKIDQIEEITQSHEYQGPVGISLAAALKYFRENETDINVIECGRGGTYDDVNVIQNDWAVITTIMEEHLSNIGPTLSDVVTNKLGIIKDTTKNIYFGPQRLDVLRQIDEDIAEKKNTKFINRDTLVSNILSTKKGTQFKTSTKRCEYSGLNIPLLGEFQALNASLAIQICEDILGAAIPIDIVKKCFESIQWPGRCEIVNIDQTFVLDGAIHRDSANYLVDIVGKIRKEEKITSIIGIPKDKDVEGVVEELSAISDLIIMTQPDICHLSFPENALQIASRFNDNCLQFELLEDAVKYVRQNKKNDIILIVGTQTLIGNAKRLFGQTLYDIGK